MSRYVAVDLEMTGLCSSKDRIIEIGAAIVEDGKLCERFSTFVDPGRTVPAEVRKLTGICDQMLLGAPKNFDALQSFLAFAGEAPLIGHNLIFDYSFLCQSAVNHKIPFVRTGIDTLKIARKVLAEPEKKSLESLCGYFKIPREQGHRALNDAEASASVFLLLKEKYGAEHPGLFEAKPMNFKAKRQTPITPAQKRDLNHLMAYHKIEPDMDIGSLTKNEASRMIDRIFATHGRMPGKAAERKEL